MKDVPVEFPQGLGLVTICEREDPRDAFCRITMTVSMRYRRWYRRDVQFTSSVPAGGTSSGSDYPLLRGNVGTRLSKLDNGDYDAIILAVAGQKRLGLEERIRVALPPELSLPAVGQGAVGIECRLDIRAPAGCLPR